MFQDITMKKLETVFYKYVGWKFYIVSILDSIWVMAFLGLSLLPVLSANSLFFLAMAALPECFSLLTELQNVLVSLGRNSVFSVLLLSFFLLVFLKVITAPFGLWVFGAVVLVIRPWLRRNVVDYLFEQRLFSYSDFFRFIGKVLVIALGMIGFGLISIPSLSSGVLMACSIVAMIPAIYDLFESVISSSTPESLRWLHLAVISFGLMASFGLLPLNVVPGLVPFVQLLMCVISADSLRLSFGRLKRKLFTRFKSMKIFSLLGLSFSIGCGAIGFQWIPVLSSTAFVFKVLSLAPGCLFFYCRLFDWALKGKWIESLFIGGTVVGFASFFLSNSVILPAGILMLLQIILVTACGFQFGLFSFEGNGKLARNFRSVLMSPKHATEINEELKFKSEVGKIPSEDQQMATVRKR